MQSRQHPSLTTEFDFKISENERLKDRKYTKQKRCLDYKHFFLVPIAIKSPPHNTLPHFPLINKAFITKSKTKRFHNKNLWNDLNRFLATTYVTNGNPN